MDTHEPSDLLVAVEDEECSTNAVDWRTEALCLRSELADARAAAKAAHYMVRCFADRTGEHRGLVGLEECHEDALTAAGCFAAPVQKTPYERGSK